MAATIRLAETLDFRAAGQLAAALAGKRGALVLDASAVTYLGGLAAQILLSTTRSAKRRITVGATSEAFDEGLRRLGIDPASLR